MARKIVNNSDAGNATTFGGNDLDQVNQYLTGTDQTATDPVTIATSTTFKDGKLIVRNPADTFSAIIKAGVQVSSDKTFTLPVTASDTIDTIAATATLTNKTIAAANNTLPGIVQEPIVGGKKVGLAQPKANALFKYGLLADHTDGTVGTIANAFDTTEGVLTTIPTSAAGTVQAGLVTPATGVGIGRRLFGARAKIRWKVDSTTSARLFFGFTSNSAGFAITDTPLAITDHGVVVGFTSAGTNYVILHNDGATSVTSDNVTGPVAKDANFHTVEISWPAAGNITVTFDGTAQVISADLPATTANLFFNAIVSTSAAVARTISIQGVWLETDK